MTQLEIHSFQIGILDLLSMHQPLAEKFKSNRDMDAKNKAKHKGLESTILHKLITRSSHFYHQMPYVLYVI